MFIFRALNEIEINVMSYPNSLLSAIKYIMEVTITNKPLLDLLLEEVLPNLHLDGLVLYPPRLAKHVLVIQPAPLHGRGVLRAELLVQCRQPRVVPSQLLLLLSLQLVPRPRQLQLVPLPPAPLSPASTPVTLHPPASCPPAGPACSWRRDWHWSYRHGRRQILSSTILAS